MKKLTLKRDRYCKKAEAKPKIKKWGKRAIPGDMGCLSDPPTPPIFVQRTPGGVLAAELKKIECDLNRRGLRKVKIVEEGGNKLRHILVKSDPWAGEPCHTSTFSACHNMNGKPGAFGDRSVV